VKCVELRQDVRGLVDRVPTAGVCARKTGVGALDALTSVAVSSGSSSFLSSLETLPQKLPNASGMRAQKTLNGRGTMPNCRRAKRYVSRIIALFGRSIGARQEVVSPGNFTS